MDLGLAERRQLRRKVSFWRVLTASIVLACAAVLWFFVGETYVEDEDHIARVSISGFIADDKELVDRLGKIAKSSAAKALIVDLETPGGSTYGGETIYKALRKVAEEKPVIANIRTMAASAGYMIALAGDHIVAGETSITGSIGVIFQYPQIKELMDKIGVSLDEIKSSPMKAEPSPFHAPSEDAKAMINAMVQDSYRWFVDLVAERRDMRESQAKALSNGAIFTGRQALKNGLVDALGGVETIKAYLKSRDIDEELPIIDWRAPDVGGVFSLPQSLALLLKLTNYSVLQPEGDMKRLIQENLFLDGLVSVWQFDAK